MEGVGHPQGMRLGQLGTVAREQLVDRAAPERQPPLEVASAQPDLRVQLRMRTERTAAVGLGSQQDGLPERGEPRDVRLEVELRDVDEDEPDASFRLNTPDGYNDRMPKPQSIAQAGLVGWRKAIADSVAPRAASRAPVSEERLRAAIGAAFFLLSLYYVASTIARMIKSAPS